MNKLEKEVIDNIESLVSDLENTSKINQALLINAGRNETTDPELFEALHEMYEFVKQFDKQLKRIGFGYL